MKAVIPALACSRDRFYRRGLERAAPIVAVLLSAWLLTAAPEARSGENATKRFDAAQSLRVRFQDGLLSLEAARKPWTQVLKEIQQETGMRFHHAYPLKGSVSIFLAALPVTQALEQLFGPQASFIFHYPPGVSGQLAVPRDVWVLGTVREGAAESRRQAKLDSHDRALPAPEEPESLSQLAEADAGLTDPALDDPEVIAQLTAMAEDKDPGTRVQALSALAAAGKTEEAEVQTAIDAALSDKDPSVRGAAFQALASRGGPEAMGSLWQALEDPDPGVRILAVESVAPGKEGEALLEEALSDADDTVRVMAAERLKQVSN
ncbi:MAG: HEAT repeat domain-containing protein [Gammaproteobacteria bacterium]